MTLGFLVTVEFGRTSRLMIDEKSLGEVLQTRAQEVCNYFSEGAKPSLSVISDQRFFVDPDSRTEEGRGKREVGK